MVTKMQFTSGIMVIISLIMALITIITGQAQTIGLIAFAISLIILIIETI